MEKLLNRWASLGVYVPGDINTFEDPEVLLSESLQRLDEDGRLLGIVASWLSKYGHLLLTKKLEFHSKRERALFAALIAASGTRNKRLLKIAHGPKLKSPEFVYRELVPVLKEQTVADPNPAFVEHGLLLKNAPLVREKIILPPMETYKRSAILRNRALYGSSLRSDLAAVLPKIGKISVRQLAKTLHVAPQTLQVMVNDFVASGLVAWKRQGRASVLEWIAA